MPNFMPRLPRLQFLHSIGNVRLSDNGVTLKHCPGSPASDLHNYTFSDSCPS
jgi:hypothetical protein